MTSKRDSRFFFVADQCEINYRILSLRHVNCHKMYQFNQTATSTLRLSTEIYICITRFPCNSAAFLLFYKHNKEPTLDGEVNRPLAVDGVKSLLKCDIDSRDDMPPEPLSAAVCPPWTQIYNI